ncbi:MAG: GlsB/YeaQ/YmgE family stress response membrane protein [Gammaproteobacteria bacterium]|nr:GlsB/YeaQ/YmgE family stress response membrane protein [Gammaproteobacteria bacterium]
MLSLMVFLLIGALAGWLAGLVMKGRGYGLWGNMGLGVVGAFVGGLLIRLLGLASQGTVGDLVTATLGAVVLIAVVRALRKGDSGR